MILNKTEYKDVLLIHHNLLNSFLIIVKIQYHAQKITGFLLL